jgi:single-stranded-DNA-specific exonuclease
MVRSGIRALQKTQKQGLLSLISISGIKAGNINATDISFLIAPRLNAAGRLESAQDALNLLSTNDLNTAGLLAQKLNLQNRERQEITQKIQESALAKVLIQDSDSLILIASDPEYNPGVVGLAASRLTERFYRPSIIAHQSTSETRGSCRSIPEFNITEALDECASLLDRYGGHAAAAGFTIQNDRFEEFTQCIKDIAKRKLGSLELAPVIQADIEIQLADLKPSILDYLELVQPTGMGNRQVTFVSNDLKVIRSKPVGRDNSHLKFTVTDGKVIYDAIAFRLGHLADNLSERVNLLYTFEVNEFNGESRLQLNVRDIHTI